MACTSAGGEGGSSYPLQELLGFPPGQRVAAELKVVDSAARGVACRHALGCGLVPPCCPGPVHEDCREGQEDGGPGGDEGDLPIAGRRAALVEWQMRPFAKGSRRLVAAFLPGARRSSDMGG